MSLLLLSLGQSNILAGNKSKVYTIIEDAYITGTTDSLTGWINIGQSEFFSIGIVIKTDSSTWTQADADSIDFSVGYELSLDTKSDELTRAFWKKGQSAPLTILTLTGADTLGRSSSSGEVAWYQSFHDGTADIAPARRIRFLIDKGSGNANISGKIKYSIYLVTQE